ncbi:hypothetical protein ACN2WE_05320 [Streptomyces sp. cg28]|uniref:hypothetical protein n=1 Tax=Streptomyces sp. cg28 TaxID=3403457 RepID=UPI003B21AB03
MKTTDILAQIDDALGDWTVGPDAMRSRPAVDACGSASRVEITDGIATVVITPDLEEFTARFQEAVQTVVAARLQAMRVAAEALQRFAEALRHEGEWGDTNAAPVEPSQRPRPPLPRRDGRPAWQTPYGPARRRR